ncbi:hypothetical protein [Pelagibacterium sediminicola]|uniref:hypothetical protein n=1 Tax=Pelagibacterium sediminicola TaxID=2248761 RepID=UPI000E324209|nr:hypothetical protein [Pelagibacterium sediminicola]
MIEPRTERITMMMEKSLVQRIEDYRFAARKGSRASAMRSLIQLALGEAETAPGDEIGVLAPGAVAETAARESGNPVNNGNGAATDD